MSDVAPPPSKRPKPQDHLEPAAQREAEGVEDVTVEWEGMSVTVPGDPGEWDADALEAFEGQLNVTGVRILLGSKRFDEIKAEFKEKHGHWKSKNVGELFNTIARACGFEDAGE